ncbi:MAG: fibrillarin-like rRNA/tRNA 2'-O-methyltransferase [Nitrososphaerales archaeon]
MTDDDSRVEQLFSGVYRVPDPRNPNKRVVATKNLTPGKSYYGESLVRAKSDGQSIEYRLWDPYRSKLAAAVINRLEVFPYAEGSCCLYLGASTGTTVSHISDIIGSSGKIFGVEVAPRVAREFLENVAKYRRNVVPIIADAHHPEKYSSMYGEISSIYCDIAQPDQTEIAITNCHRFFGTGNPGLLLLVVKASSIDALKSKNEVFSDQRAILQKSNFKVIDQIDLEPFDRNHAMLVAKPSG